MVWPPCLSISSKHHDRMWLRFHIGCCNHRLPDLFSIPGDALLLAGSRMCKISIVTVATPQSSSASAGLPARVKGCKMPCMLHLWVFGVVCEAEPKRIQNGCGGHSLSDSAGWVGWQKREPIEMISIKKAMITLHLCWSSELLLLCRPHSKTRVIRRVVGLDSPKTRELYRTKELQ